MFLDFRESKLLLKPANKFLCLSFPDNAYYKEGFDFAVWCTVSLVKIVQELYNLKFYYMQCGEPKCRGSKSEKSKVEKSNKKRDQSYGEVIIKFDGQPVKVIIFI